MREAFRDVLEFHRKLAPHLIGRFPKMPEEKNRIYLTLIDEEHKELKEAVEANDIVKVADAIGDLCYVAIGLAVTCGIDLPSVWDEIHASNMAKEGGPTREDGKILKPEGWEPPNIGKALAEQWPVGVDYDSLNLAEIRKIDDEIDERADVYDATGRLPE